MIVQRQTIGSPQASLLLTMAHPIGAVAVDILFFPLNKVDDIRLFHPVRVNAHVFGHSLNLLKFHAPSFVNVWSQAFLESPF
jgi:hypothetical protein